LELQVCDGDSYANFVIWDQDCINLIGVSAVKLMNKMIEVVLLCSFINLTKF